MAQADFHIVISEMMQEQLSLHQVEHLVRQQYIEFVRSKCESDADAAQKLGLARQIITECVKSWG